jgi:YHS domain-containing protein
MKRLIAMLFPVAGAMCSTANAQSSLTINGTTYTYCASENQECSFTGTAMVVFGTTSPSLMYDINGPFTNGVLCANGVVSATDPAYGYTKSCWYGPTSGTPTRLSNARLRMPSARSPVPSR